MKTLPMFSIFSGTFYDLPEGDITIVDEGQIPLLKNPPSNCKKCYGRGYTGRDAQNYGYIPCMCVRKVVNFSIIKRGEQQI
jgi:hypothetical protein